MSSKDASLELSGIRTVFITLMNVSVNCSLRRELFVSGCNMAVRYLDSWYVRDHAQNETIGLMGIAAHEFSVIRTVLVVAAPKILAEVSP